jgi:hypothetical protein
VGSGECKVENFNLFTVIKVESVKWRMESGELKVESVEWKGESGDRQQKKICDRNKTGLELDAV